MPVSVVCDAASVNAALRDSLSSSTSANCSSNGQNNDDSQSSLQSKLVASAKRVLLSKIEYEEVDNYSQSVLDTLKSKYIVLKPTTSSSVSSSVSTLLSSAAAGSKSSASTSPGTSISSGTGGNVSGSVISAAVASATATIAGIATATTAVATTTTTPTSTKILNNGGMSNGSNGTNGNVNNLKFGHHQNGQRDPNQLPQPKRILFPRENVQIGWKGSNRKWQVGAGMMNVGNTCYLNSTLQAIFHVPAMANWLMSDSAHRERCEDENGSQGGCIICAMSKTLIASQASQSSIKPFLVYSKLRLVCKHLIMGRQEDAHEFLRYLVEAMEKSFLSRFRNGKDLDQFSKETTPLNQILGGYLKSAVRCLSCGHVSTTFQHFQDLLLDIRKANSIEEALDGYFARERLEDMGYKCEDCKKKVSATKQFSLERAPISLCIQLKRFSMMGTKLNKHVAIRPRLDLTPYASKRNGEKLTYRLVAMVTHLGASQHCGHYTAIGLTDGGGYYQFDDNSVRPISIQNVLNTNAYIIFYELEDSNSNNNNNNNNHTNNINLSQPQAKFSNNNGISQTLNNSHNEHLIKINGQHTNENNVQRQSISTNILNSPAATNVGGSSKLINSTKLDKITNSGISSASTSATGTSGETQRHVIIGPQLPPDRSILKSQNDSEPVGNSSKALVHYNGLNTSSSPSALSKLVNHSSGNKQPFKDHNNNNEKLSNSTATSNTKHELKTSAGLNSKITIHFKNNKNCSNLTNSSATNKFQESSGSKSQAISPNKILTESINSNSTVKSNKISTTLPSIPKSSETPQTTGTLIKDFSSFLQHESTQSPSLSSPPSQSKTVHNGNLMNRLGKKVMPIKSLVPYGSDDDDDSQEDDDSNKIKNKSVDKNYKLNRNETNKETKNSRLTNPLSPITSKTVSYKTSLNNSNNSNSENNSCTINNKKSLKRCLRTSDYEEEEDKNVGDGNADDDTNSSPESSPPRKMKSMTPPSVVKSKVGLWQVTRADPITPNRGKSSSPPSQRKNPFATNLPTVRESATSPVATTIKMSGGNVSNNNTTSISSINFYSNKTDKSKLNSNNSTNKKNDHHNHTDSKETATVSHLLKLSHRGYGAPVLSWNGHKTEMEKEILEENKLERKRDLEDEDNTEMDRGRQKKMKSHSLNNNSSMPQNNPGYNPFQEHQNQNSNNRRWNTNNTNNVRSFHQNQIYRPHQVYRSQNGNFRKHNRFHQQRPHHQRNTGGVGNGGDHNGGFHYRRES